MCFIINRREVDELHTILEPYFNELLKTPEMSSQVLNKISTFRRLPTIIMTIVITGCISYAIVPIISIIHQYRHKIYPINYNLIYLTVYPWEIPRNSVIHFIHFIDEYLLTIAIVLITSAVDSLYTYYMFQMIGILREISYRISMFDEKNCEFEIRECVNKYEILVRCTKKIQKVYGVIILWTMNVNAIVLCTVIYQLSNVSDQ